METQTAEHKDTNSYLNSTIPNLEAIKAKQKATWEAGDFGQIARTIENVAEEFMAQQPLRRGSQVLDVACGTGNLAVITARQGCTVWGIDIACNLIHQARIRAAEEGLRINYMEADAEALPFDEGQFDLVVSMFGAMFAPRPEVVVAELARVTKSGGCVALASWTPEGFIGKMFNIFKAHLPPPPAGVPSPMGWGDEATARTRLQHGFTNVRLARRTALMCYPFPPAETVEFFRQYYGPTQKAFARWTLPRKPRCDGIWWSCKPLKTSPKLPAPPKSPPSIWRSSRCEAERIYVSLTTTKTMYNKENLTKIDKMNGLAPEVMKAFWAFDKAAVADGAIPVKYKELIAVAVALTTQCPYCISIHSDNARKAGATQAELTEAAMIAAALRAGAAVTHAMHALAD